MTANDYEEMLLDLRKRSLESVMKNRRDDGALKTIINAVISSANSIGYMKGYDEGHSDGKRGKDQRVRVHLC